METQLTTEPKLAIVGMEACFGDYETLEAWEQSIYQGKSQPQSETLEADLPTDWLLLKVVDRSLQDANLDLGVQVAVIVVAKNHRVGQMCDRLDLRPTLQETAVFPAVTTAQKLLVSKTVEAVLILASTGKNHLGAIVLQLAKTAKQQQRRIYAEIVPNLVDISPKSATFTQSALKPAAIGYLDLSSEKPLSADDPRLTNAIAAYHGSSCALGQTLYPGVVAEIASIIKTALCLYYRYIPALTTWSPPPNPQISEQPFYLTAQAKPWFLATAATRIAAVQSSQTQLILTEASEPQTYTKTYYPSTPLELFPLAASDRHTLAQQLDSLQQAIAASDSLSAIARQTWLTYQQKADCPYVLVLLGKSKPDILREIERAVKGIERTFATNKDWQTPAGSYFTVNPQGQKGKVAYVYPGAYNAHLGLGRNLFRIFPQLFDEPVIQSTRNRLVKLETLLYPRSWEQLSARKLEALEAKLMGDPLAMLESETGFAGLITAVLRDYFQIKPQGIFGYSLGEISAMYAQGVWTDLGQSSDRLNTSPLFKTRLAGSQAAVREYWQLSESETDIWSTYVLMADAQEVKARVQSASKVFLTQISTPQEVVIAGAPQACQQVIQDLNCDAFRAPFNHVIHCPIMDLESAELLRINTLPITNQLTTPFYSAAGYEPTSFNSQSLGEILSQTLCQQLDFDRLVKRVYQDQFRIFIEVGAGSNCSRWISKILESHEHLTVSLHRRGIEDQVSLVKALAKLLSHRVELDLTPLYNRVSPKSTSKLSNQLDFSLPKLHKKSQSKLRVQEASPQLDSAISDLVHHNFINPKVVKLTEKVALKKDIITINSNQKETAVSQANLAKFANSLKSASDPSQKNTNVVNNNQQKSQFSPAKVAAEITNSQVSFSKQANDAPNLVQNPLPKSDRQIEQNLTAANSKFSQIHGSFLQSRQENLNQISKIVSQKFKLIEQQYHQKD